MHAQLFLAGAVLATVASAQTQATGSAATSTVSQAMPATATQGFDASQVDSNLKASWCRSELAVCPEICGGVASTNTCDSTALTYECVCQNGTSPDVTAYKESLPFFICQATYDQCVAAHPDDLDGQTTCKDNEQCGTLNATEASASTSSAAASSAAATSSDSASATSAAASASSTGSSGSSDNAARSLNIEFATAAFAGVLVAAFAVLL